MNKYFCVTAKCGHVSKGHYINKDFPIIAASASEASKRVMQLPRVKKQLKNAITACIEITLEQFKILKESFKKDGYFQAKNSKQQQILCPNIQNEILELEHHTSPRKEKNFEYKQKKQRWMTDYIYFEFLHNSDNKSDLALI